MEHLLRDDNTFLDPGSLERVRNVNWIADQNWRFYSSEMLEEDISGHLLSYPIVKSVQFQALNSFLIQKLQFLELYHNILLPFFILTTWSGNLGTQLFDHSVETMFVSIRSYVDILSFSYEIICDIFYFTLYLYDMYLFDINPTKR